jgi:hypothetical protein
VKRGRSLLVFSVVVLATRLSITGCDTADSHIYTGAQYDPTLGCLEPLTSVDIVTGPEPLNVCAPICIIAYPADAGTVAYVSTMCAPYPQYPNELDAAADPQLCAAALEAFKRDALCEDGGVVLPPSEDAGVDAGGADAQDGSAVEADATTGDAGGTASEAGGD